LQPLPLVQVNGLTQYDITITPHDINSISTAPVGRMTAEPLPEIIQSSGEESIHPDRRFCGAT
jgi:hypothetical protein